MTLPASGAISLSQVATELGRASNAPVSLGESATRNLAGIPSGPISMGGLRGKSSYVAMSGSLPDTPMDGTANNNVAYTNTATLTVSQSGGTDPKNYAWSHVSGVGSIDNVNATSTTVRMPVPKLGTAGDISTQVVQCVITDATSRTLTLQCTITQTLS